MRKTSRPLDSNFLPSLACWGRGLHSSSRRNSGRIRVKMSPRQGLSPSEHYGIVPAMLELHCSVEFCDRICFGASMAMLRLVMAFRCCRCPVAVVAVDDDACVASSTTPVSVQCRRLHDWRFFFSVVVGWLFSSGIVYLSDVRCSPLSPMGGLRRQRVCNYMDARLGGPYRSSWAGSGGGVCFILGCMLLSSRANLQG